MSDSRCEVCGATGTLAAGRPDRLLVARVVVWGPPMYIVEASDIPADFAQLLPGSMLTVDISKLKVSASGVLREQIILHLRCLPSWLDEHPELALTSAKPSDL